jgi:hypothetical protein
MALQRSLDPSPRWRTPLSRALRSCSLSQTSDPEGAYSLYVIDADPTDLDWADFPTIGFNKNWIAIT